MPDAKSKACAHDADKRWLPTEPNVAKRALVAKVSHLHSDANNWPSQDSATDAELYLQLLDARSAPDVSRPMQKRQQLVERKDYARDPVEDEDEGEDEDDKHTTG